MDWQARLKRLGQKVELRALLGGLVLLATIWGFVELADLMAEGGAKSFDAAVLEALRLPDDASQLRGPEWLYSWTRELTALGSGPVLGLITLFAVGFLLVSQSWKEALFLAIAAIGGGGFNHLLKVFFARERPDVGFHLMDASHYSFPSGHAMAAATIYLVIGSLAAALVQRRSQKLYILAVAILLPLLVGTTRVVLGVHYPTDVFAGWAAGLAWALMCWGVHEQWHGRLFTGPSTA